MEKSLKSKETIMAIGLALLGATLYSSKAISVKLAYEYDVDKITLLMLRMGFALPIYGFMAFNQPRHAYNEELKSSDWILLVALGVIGYYFASFLDFWGLKYISASLERLILFIYPTLTTLFAAVVFKRKLRLIDFVAIVVSYSGILVAFYDKLGETNVNFWLGALLIFLSALTFSFYLVGSEKLIPKFGAKRFTIYCMIVSCISVIIHYLIVNQGRLFDLEWQVYALGLFIAVVNTVIPSFLISAAISKIGAATTATLSSIGPISVIILAAFFLDEPITFYKILGTLIVIIGVFIISKSKK